MVTAQFVNIGATSAISISDIVPTGDDTYNNVAIQTLDSAGRTLDNYVWTDAGGEGWDQIGWVNDDNEIVTGVSFEPGQGLWTYGSAVGQGVQIAGKVGTNDIVVQLCNGGTGTGNPFPVEVKIGDLVPSGDDCYNNVSIQTLDSAGRTVDNYVWTDAGGEGWDQIGWVNDDNEIVTDVQFSPGQGLWVFGSSTEQYLTFPAPELK